MISLTSKDILTHLRQSWLLALIALSAVVAAYVVLEPVIGHSQVYDQFTITQGITSEISFVATAADVSMTSLPGITGGTATGSTQVRVYTNDSLGYTMTIAASGTPAMQGNAQGGNIPDYTVTTPYTPDYNYTLAANTAAFAYTVSASTTSDLAQKFRDDGAGACNTGSADTNGVSSCWYGLSTTATSTINRGTPTAASGATTTIFFRTTINSNPSPSIPEDTYVATTTLTATAN